MSGEDRDEVARMRGLLLDADPWLRLGIDLRTDPTSESSTACFVLAREGGAGLCGFAEVSLRSFAEGSWEFAGDDEQPSAYVEACWVDPDARRAGAGRRLWEACEIWARARGSIVLASSASHDDQFAHAVHRALGCTRVAELFHFAKPVTHDASSRVHRANLEVYWPAFVRLRGLVFPGRPHHWHRAHVERHRMRTPGLPNRAYFVPVNRRDVYAEVVLRSPAVAEIEACWVPKADPIPGNYGELVRGCEGWAHAQGARVLLTTSPADDRLPHERHEHAGFAMIGRRVHYVKRVAERPRPSAPPPEQVQLMAAIYDRQNSKAQTSEAKARLQQYLVEHGHPLGEVLELKERLQKLPRSQEPPGVLARLFQRWQSDKPSLREELDAQYRAAVRRFIAAEARCPLDEDGPAHELPGFRFYDPPIDSTVPVAFVEDLAHNWMLAGVRSLRFWRTYCDERCRVFLRSPYLERVEEITFGDVRVSTDTLVQVVSAQRFPALRTLHVNGGAASDWANPHSWDCPDYVAPAIRLAQLECLLAIPDIARLRVLSLACNDLPIEAADRILECRYLDGLERLSVVAGNFGCRFEDPIRQRTIARLAQHFGDRLVTS